MVYGELGRFPIEIIIKLRMATFWNNLLVNSNKISGILYKLVLKLHQGNPTHFKWIAYVKSIFDECGLSFVWNDQIPMDKKILKNLLKQNLVDQFIQHWFSQINNASRGQFYGMFKNEFKLEPYLLRLQQSDRIYLCKFRCSNVKLPIETGRWGNIPKENRICHLCNVGIGDEYHYLFLCSHPYITDIRQKFIPQYYTRYPCMEKLKMLLSYCNVPLYKQICFFLKKLVSIL